MTRRYYGQDKKKTLLLDHSEDNKLEIKVDSYFADGK